MIPLLFLIASLAHAGSPLDKLMGCEGDLVSVTVAHVNRHGVFEFTGIAHRVTAEHIDFGGVIIPIDRIMYHDKDTVRRPVPGDLITYFTPQVAIEGARIVQRSGIFKRVEKGVVVTAAGRTHGVDFVSALLIIAPGTRVRIAVCIDDVETQSFEAMYVGHEGTRLNFGGVLYEEDDIVGLYAL